MRATNLPIFLMEMMKGLDNTCNIDCTNTTDAGLVDGLFNNNIQMAKKRPECSSKYYRKLGC